MRRIYSPTDAKNEIQYVSLTNTITVTNNANNTTAWWNWKRSVENEPNWNKSNLSIGGKSFNGRWIYDIRMKEYQKIYSRSVTKWNWKLLKLKLLQVKWKFEWMQFPNKRLMYGGKTFIMRYQKKTSDFNSNNISRKNLIEFLRINLIFINENWRECIFSWWIFRESKFE